LVLNADFRPLSYYPLSLWSWQDTVKAVFLDRVNIVSEYDREVRSSSFSMRLPSVVSLKSYVRPARYPAFTRFNVFLRDRFSCQYCGHPGELTFDHVVPRSKGGMMPREARMHPYHEPHRPTVHELHRNGRLFPPNYLHQSWLDYLYWDTELEP
jgi:5-methylcytosine-specific restriction endonuclease McrA